MVAMSRHGGGLWLWGKAKELPNKSFHRIAYAPGELAVPCRDRFGFDSGHFEANRD
jgi:hypothetical protein